MTLIEPVKKDIVSNNNKKYPASLRLWHWVNALVISGSLITVLINSTLNSRENITPLIQNELSDSGTAITKQQASAVAHSLGDSVWHVHTYIGYVLAGLLLFRLIMELFQLADQKLIRKIKIAYKQFQTSKQNREIARHELAVKSIYATFYVLLIVMAVTGLFLAFEDELAAFKSIRHSVKEVHGFCMYLVIAFIVIHLVGVFLAERKDGKGIVSDMINGGGQ